MREVKFRGKAVMLIEELDRLGFEHENGWIVGNLIYGTKPFIVGGIVEVARDYLVHETWVEVIPETVGQFTGLKDVNGVEIYEGDIIHIVGEQELGLGSEYLLAWDDKAVVKWNEDECCYYLDLIRKYTVRFSDFEVASKDTFELRKWDEEEWYIEYTVVGNIWEGAK